MKPTSSKLLVTALFILGATTFLAQARAPNYRSFRELDKRSDLIVVARPLSTQVTLERSTLLGLTPGIPVIGLSSKFEVIFTLKGKRNLKKILVHHYRLADPEQRMINGPFLASFDPNDDARYLLFLQREKDGRFAPFNQTDPAETAMLKLKGPEWAKLSLDYFRTWLNAKKWLNKDLPWMNLSPNIPHEGWGEGSLLEAAMNGKSEKAKMLIRANPDLVFIRNGEVRVAPLHVAVEYGHKEVAKLLLASKADVDAKLYGGWTPLFNAVSEGHRDIVKLLIAHKAQVSVQDDGDRSPLHLAAENGFTDIVALLLTYKADINAKNRAGLTPLHLAAALDHKECVELLLAKKAEINSRNANGKTPLAMAAANDHKDVAELLRLHGAME